MPARSRGRASTCGARERTMQDTTPLSGPSGTEATEKARAALHTILQEPSGRSPSISPPNTLRPRAKAVVIPMKSQSPTS
jgi:hypothetical protein